MALKLATSYKGIPFSEAYHEIILVRIDKGRDATLVQLKVWTDSTKQHDLPEAGGMHFLPYAPDATVEWAYTQLKTLPEFADAVDV